MATDFEVVFTQLRGLLSSIESNLVVKADSSTKYSLDTPYSEKYQKEVFFGAAVILRNDVSYHLMPVYVFPELLADISPTLKKKLRGKSCFHFKTILDSELFELQTLTTACFEKFVRGGLINQINQNQLEPLESVYEDMTALA
jgi:hypothetical protein